MYAVYAFCREVDDIADDWPAARARSAPASRSGATRSRRSMPGGRATSIARALREPVARYRAAARAISTAVIDGMEMDAVEDIRAPRPRDARPLLRAGSPARSGICRCMCSAIRATAAHRGRRRARPRACSSPTSCATSTRMRGAAGSICRARCSTATASAPTSRRGAAPSGAAGGLPRPRRDRRAAISPRRDAAMARCSRRAMRPAAVMGAFYRAMLDGAAARRTGATRAARVSLSKPQKLWLVLRHGLV